MPKITVCIATALGYALPARWVIGDGFVSNCTWWDMCSSTAQDQIPRVQGLRATHCCFSGDGESTQRWSSTSRSNFYNACVFTSFIRHQTVSLHCNLQLQLLILYFLLRHKCRVIDVSDQKVVTNVCPHVIYMLCTTGWFQSSRAQFRDALHRLP